MSVGDYDFVKAALDRLGALEWRQVAIKPAKPLAFGVVQGTPVFGLPGNPVSSLVSFELFARPALLPDDGPPAARSVPRSRRRAEHDVPAAARRQAPPRPRARRRGAATGYVVARTGAQASNVLSATAAANGLALLPDGDGVAAGDPVRVMLLDAPPTTSSTLLPRARRSQADGRRAMSSGPNDRAVAGNSHSRPLPCLPPPAVRMLRPAPRRPELECGG